MDGLSLQSLLDEIALLEQGRFYPYVSDQNQFRIDEIASTGHVLFSRYARDSSLKRERIPPQVITTIAAACSAKPDYPLHIDRLFSAGGNTRSALESILAHTPHFFMCNPDRFDVYSGQIKRDLKHIMWCPNDVHPVGTITPKAYSGVINEQETSIQFGNIVISQQQVTGSEFESIDSKRVHVQMQVALIEIAHALDMHTWIARNDHAVRVGDAALIDKPGVIRSLDEIKIFFDDRIKRAAEYIDVVWYQPDERRVPAVFEIEHSTGVTSGMTRMLRLQNEFAGINTIYTVVAPDELRAKVMSEITSKVFAPLHARYMPYSKVRELYGLIQRYPLSGVVDYRFVTAFMESFS